ncbi:MAG: NAD(P)H-quinone oxidoreductase [Rhodospirillales bacterium]
MIPNTQLPTTMTAIEISKPGGPEVLVANKNRKVPQPGTGEVLIKVASAGVNRPDLQQRAGNYNPPPGASDLPGLEVAGSIVALGAGVTQWKLGDQVCALTPGGGYAEYCLTAATHCLPIPKGFSMIEAAALPETYFTVWHNVFQRARLKPGESFLVHGGASGIGTTAIQLAHAFGCKVFATVGSDDKKGACEKLGASKVINYKAQDYGDVVREATGGKGVDVVLDMVAGEYIDRDLQCMAFEGRLAIIAVQGGLQATINVARMMMHRQTIVASTLRAQSVEAKAAMASALREKVWPLLDAGTVKPVLFKTFKLDQAAQAHAELEAGRHIGKIMLSI